MLKELLNIYLHFELTLSLSFIGTLVQFLLRAARFN